MQVDNATTNNYFLKADVKILASASNYVIPDWKIDAYPELRAQLGYLVANGKVTVDTEPAGYTLVGQKYQRGVPSWLVDPAAGADNTQVAASKAATAGSMHTVLTVEGSYDDPTGLGELQVYDTALGVFSGMVVAQDAPVAMAVAVASGVAIVNGARITVAGNDVSIDAAHATLPRIDIIIVGVSGTATEVAGTPAATPVAPAVPADSVLLATVSVPATDTTIENAQITNSVKTAAVLMGRVWVHGSNDVEGPMIAATGRGVSASLSAGGAGIAGKISIRGKTE